VVCTEEEEEEEEEEEDVWAILGFWRRVRLCSLMTFCFMELRR
jgi:hypothetical protein